MMQNFYKFNSQPAEPVDPNAERQFSGKNKPITDREPTEAELE